MSDVLISLRRQDFPRCAASALKHMGSNRTPGDGAQIPGLGSSTEDLAEQLAKEFIFRETKGSKVNTVIQIGKFRRKTFFSRKVADNTCKIIFSLCS